jgi:hypothetical protein
MANIQSKVTNRHDWTYRPLPGLPGALELKKLGRTKWGLLCMNCRKAWDPDDGSPPVDGCPTGVKVMNMGRSRQADHVAQENRALREQADREFRQEIHAGARDDHGNPILE